MNDRGGDSMWASMCNQVLTQLRSTKRYFSGAFEIST